MKRGHHQVVRLESGGMVNSATGLLLYQWLAMLGEAVLTRPPSAFCCGRRWALEALLSESGCIPALS